MDCITDCSHFGTRQIQKNTLVVSTHGIVKKTSKTPDCEIQKARQVRSSYFQIKEMNKKEKK